MRKFRINERIITQDSKPFIIAEIGNNHNGSVKLCKSLMLRAKQGGADAVKLQKRCPEKLFTKNFSTRLMIIRIHLAQPMAFIGKLLNLIRRNGLNSLIMLKKLGLCCSQRLLMRIVLIF